MEIAAGDFDLNEKDVIGEGGQGCVYKAFWKVKQIPVAVKKINLSTNAAKREVSQICVTSPCTYSKSLWLIPDRNTEVCDA